MGDQLKELRKLQQRTASLPSSRNELVGRILEMLSTEEKRVEALGNEAQEALELADSISSSIENATNAIKDVRRVWAEVK
jgi:seryl-tRNA synthetase